MTKPKYATPEERWGATRQAARAQMRAQWERQREESGQDLGYFGCHRRVRTARGPAKNQKCDHCDRQALHWAYIHDTDPADPKNYMPLCQKCHWQYDKVGAKVVAAKGPDGCHAIAVKAWETKRRKRRERNDALDRTVVGDPAPDGVGSGQ